MRRLNLRRISKVLCFAFSMLLIVGVAYAQRLNLGSASGAPGTDVTIPITLDYEGETPDISSISVEIGFDPNALDYVSIEIGPVSEEAEKEAMANLVSSNLLRVAILGYNQNVIQSGTVANITFHIKSGASGQITLYNTPSASDPNGDLVTVTGGNGQITVEQVQYPTINAMTLDMGSILSGGTGIVDHYDFGDFGTPGTMPYIFVQTATASDSPVDVYVKVTYPDGRSAWLYEEAGAMIYHNPTETPSPEYSDQVFSEGTVLPILVWWFNPIYEDLTNTGTGGYELPDGVYTWDIYLVPAGTSISSPDDVAANACASATASVTLTTDRP